MIKEQGTVELGHCVIVFRDGQAQEKSFSGSWFQDFRQPVFS